jgi:hypothetical protein
MASDGAGAGEMTTLVGMSLIDVYEALSGLKALLPGDRELSLAHPLMIARDVASRMRRVDTEFIS